MRDDLKMSMILHEIGFVGEGVSSSCPSGVGVVRGFERTPLFERILLIYKSSHKSSAGCVHPNPPFQSPDNIPAVV